jgi:hypothetical protein
VFGDMAPRRPVLKTPAKAANRDAGGLFSGDIASNKSSVYSLLQSDITSDMRAIAGAISISELKSIYEP